MKRLISALGLAALLGCEPAEKDNSTTPTDSHPEVLTLKADKVKLSARLREITTSTVPECIGSLLYVNAAEGAAVFCSPIGSYLDADFNTLKSKVGAEFYLEGNLKKDFHHKPVLISGLSSDSTPRFPLYQLKSITAQENFPAHINLQSSGYSSSWKEKREILGVCGIRNLYFVKFDRGSSFASVSLGEIPETTLTFCSTSDISEQGRLSGLGHKIEYQKDLAGQPVYVADDLKLIE